MSEFTGAELIQKGLEGLGLGEWKWPDDFQERLHNYKSYPGGEQKIYYEWVQASSGLINTAHNYRLNPDRLKKDVRYQIAKALAIHTGRHIEPETMDVIMEALKAAGVEVDDECLYKLSVV